MLNVNDISNVSSLLRCVLFADDTNILCSCGDAREISKTVYIELDELHSYCVVNTLFMNALRPII